jgi:hypothetical protein
MYFWVFNASGRVVPEGGGTPSFSETGAFCGPSNAGEELELASVRPGASGRVRDNCAALSDTMPDCAASAPEEHAEAAIHKAMTTERRTIGQNVSFKMD